ncbi:MAG: SDR family NAD(P)-dependent oxidoreductase [Chloroflexi bacterium]|nr:SDR family NAD(P)-dependent oxidoreductase [Chloroflexota bacterium]
MFSLAGKVAVVTGGSGTLGTGMSKGLLDAGARVCIIGRDLAKAQRAAQAITSDTDKVLALSADVTRPEEVQRAADMLISRWERVDILVNAAGGNRPDATTSPKQSFFDLNLEAMRATFDLNLTGTIVPSQIFGRSMVRAKRGSIVNISSMAAVRPLTRVVSYAAAKASVDNFTRWLAVHMAKEYSPDIRVNAMAPGFFLAEQNRAMLVDVSSGELTPRGKSIIDHTPMNRFGHASDLVGTLVWLASDASAFVTGIVVPVDGGFSAFNGV